MRIPSRLIEALKILVHKVRREPPPAPPSAHRRFSDMLANVEVLSAPAMDANEGPCPKCGSDHFFLRNFGQGPIAMLRATGHYATDPRRPLRYMPTPRCFACGYNGLYEQGPKEN